MNILFELITSTLYKNKLVKNTVRSETKCRINMKQNGVDTCTLMQRLRKILGPERNDVTGDWKRL